MGTLFLKPAPFDFGAIFSNIFTEWYYYLFLVVAVVIVILFAIKRPTERNNLSDTQKIVYCAVLSALAFIANYFTIKVSDALQISLVATVGFIAGYLLGAGWGFAVSFIGDFICGIVAPFGAYNPIIGIGTGFWGFVPGVIFSFNGGNKYLKAIISFIISFVVNSFAVNTLGLALMYSLNFNSLLALLPVKLLTVTINACLCIGVISLLPRILPKNKFNL